MTTIDQAGGNEFVPHGEGPTTTHVNCSHRTLTSPTAQPQQILALPKVRGDYTRRNIGGKAPKHPILSAPPPRGGQSFISFIAPPTTVVIMCSRDELTMSTPEGRARPHLGGKGSAAPGDPPTSIRPRPLDPVGPSEGGKPRIAWSCLPRPKPAELGGKGWDRLICCPTPKAPQISPELAARGGSQLFL